MRGLRIRSGLDIFLVVLALGLLIVVGIGLASRSSDATVKNLTSETAAETSADSASAAGESSVSTNFGFSGDVAAAAAPVDAETASDAAASEEQAAAGSDESATLEQIEQPDQFSASWDLNGTFAVVRAIMNVNVRTGPSLDYGVKRSIPVETQVQVLRRSIDNEWIRVMLSDGEEGWIYGQLLAFDAAED
jgi:uncharacterized protein YgiM (DUF1202 family)